VSVATFFFLIKQGRSRSDCLVLVYHALSSWQPQILLPILSK